MTEFPSPRSGWRRFLLPASLLFNLFLVALVGGHMLRTRQGEQAPMPSLMRALASAESALSPSDAAAFGAVWKRDATRYGEVAGHLEASRAKLEQSIVAEPYDKEAVQHALDDWQDSWGQFIGQARSTLVDALGEVSPEGRRKLVALRRRTAMGAEH